MYKNRCRVTEHCIVAVNSKNEVQEKVFESFGRSGLLKVLWLFHDAAPLLG